MRVIGIAISVLRSRVMLGLLATAVTALLLMSMAGVGAAHGVYVKSNPASDARHRGI